jgi:eukaryotic-like serine/threonine-protein kinase
MSLAPGTTLGPYEILSPLGAGGMGEVYRARDTRLERTVAIKILPQEMSRDPLHKQRFEREAKTISSLNHPHICVLHDVGSQDGLSYLVMECLEGETLAKRLENGPLPLEQVLKFGAQVADALDKAHRIGLVHRDLKPGNIMLTATGAKLLDFGLAKPAVASSEAATMTATLTQSTPRTREGTIVGTFQYMSPEQVEGKDLDGRSDIFSLGVVLYEMITGQRAFEGKSSLSVASAILEKEPTPISTIKPATPLGLDHIVKRCLAKEPEQRWQSASDLKSELNWIAESGSPAAAVAAVGQRKKSQGLVPWTAVVIVAAVLVALLANYSRMTSKQTPLVVSSVTPPPGTRYDGLPKISPDGRTLLLVLANTEGRDSLWLRPLDSASAQPLAGTEGAYRPFWSPDGRSIGFFADGKLKTIPGFGGPVLAVCDAPFSTGGSWNERGMILFVPQFGAGIYKVPASGGSPTLVLNLDRSKFSVFGDPDFLPDGEHFTYAAGGFDQANTGTYLASIDGHENRLITRVDGNRGFSSGYLFFPQASGSRADLVAVAFDPARGEVKGEPKLVAREIRYEIGSNESPFAVSGGTLIYETNPPGAATGTALVWVDRSGKKISVVGEEHNAFDLRLSPDARHVAYSRGSPNSDIWIQELKREVPMRLTFDLSVDKGSPVWAPDGSEILFDVSPGGKTRAGVYRKSSSGTGTEELLAQPKEPGARLWPTDWSQDRKFILCVQGEIIGRDQGEIWVVPLSGDRKPRVLIRAPGAAYDGQFSPDGRWVAYVSKESGHEQVYVVPFDRNQVENTPPFEQVAIAKRWQVSANGGSSPKWRRDGKELFYVGSESRFVSVGVETKGTSFSLGETQPLFRQNVFSVTSPYDVSPDGQRFLINTSGELGTLPLTLVVNWEELLKRQQRRPGAPDRTD